jgi:hypothetical protein
MLGLGSLTLPGVFARLGWIPALILFCLCAVGTIYSGRLFTLLAQMVSVALLQLRTSPACHARHRKSLLLHAFGVKKHV